MIQRRSTITVVVWSSKERRHKSRTVQQFAKVRLDGKTTPKRSKWGQLVDKWLRKAA